MNNDELQSFIDGASGCWVLYSNAEKDPTAQFAYQQRNDIELLFDDMKNLVDCNRLSVHSENVMQGRLLINLT